MESAEAFESPGKYLKAMRESLNLSLKEVADATRIREPVLRALEEDRYENLPPFYIKSFLSAYAGCLGLDPNEVITAHQRCAEKLSFSKDQVLQPPSTIRRERSNVRLLVISISVVFLIALIAYVFIELSR
jgi:cytoskeleton protein RodZ